MHTSKSAENIGPPFVKMEAFPAGMDSNPDEYPGNSLFEAIIAQLEMGNL